MLAGICRSLAEQLDTATGSHTGTQSMAIPGLAKQLQVSLESLLSLHPVGDSFMDWLMSDEDFDTEHEYKQAKATEHASSLIQGAA